MKILVVDDDRVLADVISFTLRKEGYQILLAHDGATALRRWEEETPDLIVLDVNLPRVDGFSILEQIRSAADTPVIMLTVRREEDDIIRGLEIGADDYIVKPFSPRQLVARVQAVLRRAGKQALEPIREFDDLALDMQRRQVQIGPGPAVSLTPLEARLLECLLLQRGQLLLIEDLLREIWGPRGGDRDMLRQLVHRLRQKIEADPSNPELIETVPGVGYGFTQAR
ncbi:MAG: response regulator transcription factor [Anaerolineales bacterium]|nr:response regulator transcription factor [Anaerolineales bacterium]